MNKFHLPNKTIFHGVSGNPNGYSYEQARSLTSQKSKIDHLRLRLESYYISGLNNVNISLNFFFLWLCPLILDNNPDSIVGMVYSEEIGVGYAFISNLVATIVTLILLIPDIFKTRIQFDATLLRNMLTYSLPLLIVGLAGMVNEVSDKIFLKYLWPDQETALDQVGIYGACFRLAVLMTLFTQMFRYAAEPFFFAQAKEINSKTVYADVMKYFIIFGLIIFLIVMLYIDIFKYFIGSNFHEGLNVVPIVLFANLF